MKNQILFLILLSLYCISCNNETEQQSETIHEFKISEIDSLLKRYHELNRFSGVVLISNKESNLYNKSFGFANYEVKKPFSESTAFKIGEISELVTSRIINEMAANGDLQLSDEVSKYLPEMKTEFTIADLLNHKTNFPDIATIQKQYPNLNYSTIEYANLAEVNSNKPGKSDLNFNILGLLIEKVSRKSFQENIFDYAKRLSLKDTYFQKTASTQEATGYLFYNFRGNGLELQESPVYSLEAAFSSRGIKSSANDLAKIIYSKPDINVEIDGYLSNDGFSYSIFYRADNGIAIIVLSNRRHPVAKEISNAINNILKGISYKVPLRRNPKAINPEILSNYIGKYKLNEFVKFEVIKEEDSLFVLLGPNKVALIPQSENQFYMLDSDASMRFEEDSTNKVNSVVLLNGFIKSDERALKIEN
ncbi:serine hydrolase domain-containing protein [Marivirga arenosa]|uniref:Serine hydrolase domain-containing protein n=1 Tax=Marivirga arenosa TaxID=3059076 RepID=A0AA51N7Q9_9BACT|nr:serine hydrolase domain-containing protein [Marivirga sp. ABR2-2]WMN07558.1 serine hydrolase domain-containing protein [Marivirga sp. ABR2-2]